MTTPLACLPLWNGARGECYQSVNCEIMDSILKRGVFYVLWGIFALWPLLSIAQEQPRGDLREAVVVVRPKYRPSATSFLLDFSKSLKRDGYEEASEMLKAFAQGGFGSGVVIKEGDRFYALTNRHVVAQAEHVSIEFPDSDRPTQSECAILLGDEVTDLALVALPRDYVSSSYLILSEEKMADGRDVFSAGYPGLGDTPSWQFGKGIISNSRLSSKGFLSDSTLRLLQHTAQVDAGSSGGALLVKADDAPCGYTLVGVNTWKARARENVNISLPISLVRAFLDRAVVAQPKTTEQDLRAAAQGFAQAMGGQYRDALPYVSDEYIVNVSVNAFYDLYEASPEDIQELTLQEFRNGRPIEGVRIALADAMVKRYATGENGVRAVKVDPVNPTKGEVTVVLGGKEQLSTWTLEQGAWKLEKLSDLRINTLGKDGVSKTFGYRFAVRATVGIPLTASEGMQYGLMFSYTRRTFFFAEFDAYYGQYYFHTPADEDIAYWEYSESTETKRNRVGYFAGAFGLGVQVPVKVKSFYISPYLRALMGAQFVPGDRVHRGVRSEFGGALGLDFARKIQRSTYIILGVEGKLGYLRRNFTEQQPWDAKPLRWNNTVNIRMGITF